MFVNQEFVTSLRREIACKVLARMQEFVDDDWSDEEWDACVAVCAEYGMSDDDEFVSELCDNWSDWCGQPAI